MDTTSGILIDLVNLDKRYPVHGSLSVSVLTGTQQYVVALSGINLRIRKGESLGLVGQSGCGKTTLGLMLCLLERPTHGTIKFGGQEISRLKGKALKSFRRKVQIVFQDPYESLNPRMRVEEAVGEPLVIHEPSLSKTQWRDHVRKTLELVELRPAERFLGKYPHELSGGERQRVAIARAIILNPVFLVADEPVSMLDVSVRAGILNLMLKLKQELDMTNLFITHDLSVARYTSDRLAIMCYGRIVELGTTERVLEHPLHPYTKLLLGSVLLPDPTIARAKPQVDCTLSATSARVISGCFLQSTCPFSVEECRQLAPNLGEIESEHLVACHSAGSKLSD